MKKETLPSLRVEEKTIDLVEQAIKKYNESSIVKLSQREFRRLAYEYLAGKILNGESLNDLLELGGG